MARSAAIPDNLTAYGLDGASLDAGLAGQAPRLTLALLALRMSASEGIGAVPALDLELLALARSGFEHDGWVGVIGEAFRQADSDHTGLADVDDAALAAAVDDVLASRTADALRELLASGASAADIRAFADALTDAERVRLVDHDPDLVGNLDGIPFDMRFAANRLRIEQARDETAIALDAAQRAGIDTSALETRLDTLDSFLVGDRQFLLFANEGRGLAAEVHGDLGSADHVSVLVPGMSNTLDNFNGLSRNARDLQRLADSFDGTSSHTAVIAWLGYETPEIGSVAFVDLAERGAPALPRMVDGLQLSDAVTTTVIAHSYGSTLTGTALRDEGLDVDNVVLIGSPGARVDSIDEYDLPDTDFYVGRAPLDAVTYTNWFGRDPSDPRFGATRITTDPDDGVLLWHSSYFEPNSDSLANLAFISIDRDDAVHTMPPTWQDYVVQGVDAVQDFANDAAGVQHSIVDGVQDHVPLPGFVDAFIDGNQVVSDVLLDGANTVVDGGEFVFDLGNDFIDDVNEVGGQLVEEGLEQGGELVEDVLDAADPRNWF